MKFRTISAFALLCMSSLSYADVLKLENGDIITGNIVSFKDGLCVFSTPYGSSLRVAASDIKELLTETQYAVTLNNGDRVTGQLKTSASGQAKVIRDGAVSSFSFSEIKDFSIVREDNSALANVEKKKESYSSPLNYLSDYTVLLNPGEVDLHFGYKYRT